MKPLPPRSGLLRGSFWSYFSCFGWFLWGRWYRRLSGQASVWPLYAFHSSAKVYKICKLANGFACFVCWKAAFVENYHQCAQKNSSACTVERDSGCKTWYFITFANTEKIKLPDYEEKVAWFLGESWQVSLRNQATLSFQPFQMLRKMFWMNTKYIYIYNILLFQSYKLIYILDGFERYLKNREYIFAVEKKVSRWIKKYG